MAIFQSKPWVNLFRKISIFRLFELLGFFSLERRFFVLEYRKTHFPGIYQIKKKVEKREIFFDRNHGSTPLEISQSLDLLKFFFYSLERLFYVLEYRKTQFPGLYCQKKKLEKWPFLH